MEKNNKEKQRHLQKKNLTLLILLRFKNFFIPLSPASYDTLKARVFRNNAAPLKIYLLQKIVLNFGNLISVETRIFVKTNNQCIE